MAPVNRMDVTAQPAIRRRSSGDEHAVRGLRGRAAGRVGGEEDAFSEGVDEDGASGIDERQEPGRLE